MTTNYWAHQDITRKNFHRAGGDVEMLKRLGLQSVNPINRLVMVLFYQQVLSPTQIYWVFSCPNHVLNTCISGSLPAKWIWNCLLGPDLGLVWPLLSSPGSFSIWWDERESVMTGEHTITITHHHPHCVVMKGNEVLWSDRTTHSRLRCEM